jgi:hypothetical protein
MGELSTTELSSLLDWWECWSYLATGAVFIGVVGEAVPTFMKFPRIPRRRVLFKKCSLFLLIVGLAGELLTLVRTGSISGILVARINGDTELARKEAAEATALAVALKREDRLAQEQLEKRLAPRSLSLDQMRQVLGALRSFHAPAIDIVPTPYGRDLGGDVARDIRVALEGAGWEPAVFEPTNDEYRHVSGILVEIDPASPIAEIPKAAEVLVAALKSCNLDVNGPTPTLPGPIFSYAPRSKRDKIEAPIRLTVGSK